MIFKVLAVMWFLQGCRDIWTGFKKCDGEYAFMAILAFMASGALVCASIASN
ncbi:hypothetical protein PQE74_gp019 [Bacillus phage vB_BanS_Chewbecca]|uniref:Uncharacterized protein n=1 Tax=Bacillus phage vB_BanS_Chewbecca TaxID=2894786 RepID=A0AAE8YMD4_9CAUD|nr:hypothetical protein PQE74_gp019 [Bacillus phage vB_BanS_Chewbecca]UGO46102.1 hypothetical protein CHEWBECCA_19 [Bacillus phage vB_BanS_Chewbecca]